jgi:hypothetical protein
MNEIPEIKLGKYQHYKGKFYQVISIATHSETLEHLVVYQQLYGEKSIWVRPYEMFMEEVNIDGETIKRFKAL